MKLARRLLIKELAGEEGFEPSLPGPEPAVLPLDDSPATDVTESKSGPFPELLNTIRPMILTRGSKSLSSNPTGAHLNMYQVRPIFAPRT